MTIAVNSAVVNRDGLPDERSSYYRMPSQARRSRFGSWHMAVAASFLCLLLLTIGIVGYFLDRHSIISLGVNSDVIQAWQKRLQRQEQQIDRTRDQAHAQLEVLTKRVAELQTELYQLQSLSHRLAEIADVDMSQLIGELYTGNSYSSDTDLGGHTNMFEENGPIMPADFMQTLDGLDQQLSDRAAQLAILEKLLLRRGIADSMMGIGQIVDRGWVSSFYGYRTDPFTKRVAMHKGLDISGAAGTPIRSLAAGIVRFSGKKPGYGNIVEIDHGNEFITRYGHNHNNLVVVGDIVSKGQVVAHMGNTGRSTGPHVHFEILRNNENLNPLAYIQTEK